MTLQIVEVKNSSELKNFIRFPHTIYKNDPHWVPPLDMERKDFVNRKKNPFFRHGEAALFLALKDGQPVGRISAQIHHGHLEKFKDDAGFFGFFETIEEPAVAAAQVPTATRASMAAIPSDMILRIECLHFEVGKAVARRLAGGLPTVAMSVGRGKARLRSTNPVCVTGITRS